MFASCSKEDELRDSELIAPLVEQNEIDKYIETTFTDPFNMVVDYRWSGKEVDADKQLVPIKFNLVKPFCTDLKRLWIEPYQKVIGDVFVKKYFPKQLVLIGSPNYNSDGTITHGQAENGRKITIFSLNHYDNSNKAGLKKLYATLHHELSHILHQTKMYHSDFKKITPESYTSVWYNIPLEDARSKGFITSYAMEQPDEDFAEMVAHMIVYSPDEWDAILKDPKTDSVKLAKKKLLIEEYFKDKWEMDISEVQKIVFNRIRDL